MADLSEQTSVGGQYYTNVAAGTGAGTVVLAGAGRACKLIVTAGGTAALTLYDNASAASGTKIYVSSATMDAGTVVTLDVPVANGIVAKNITSCPGYIVTYSKDTAYGR